MGPDRAASTTRPGPFFSRPQKRYIAGQMSVNPSAVAKSAWFHKPPNPELRDELPCGSDLDRLAIAELRRSFEEDPVRLFDRLNSAHPNEADLLRRIIAVDLVAVDAARVACALGDDMCAGVYTSGAFAYSLYVSLLRGDSRNTEALCAARAKTFSMYVSDLQTRQLLEDEYPVARLFADSDAERKLLDSAYAAALGYLNNKRVTSPAVSEDVLEATLSAGDSTTYGILARRFPRALYECPGRILTTIENTSPRHGLFFHHLPRNTQPVDLALLEPLVSKWKHHSWGFVKAFGKRAALIARTHADFFQELYGILEKAGFDDFMGKTVAALDSLHLTKYRTLVLESVRITPFHAPQIVAGLRTIDGELPCSVKECSAIAAGSKENSEAALRIRAARDLNITPAEVETLQNQTGAQFAFVFASIPPLLWRTNKPDVQRAIQFYGGSIWGIFSKYGENSLTAIRTMEKSFDVARRGMNLCAGELYALLDEDEWKNAPAAIQSYGESAGITLRALAEAKAEDRKKFIKAADRCRDISGLKQSIHFARTAGDSLDCTWISDIIANYSPLHRPGVPLGFWGLPEHDHNLSIYSKCAGTYQVLRRHNRCGVAECGSPAAFIQSVEEFCNIHSRQGRAAKLRWVILSGHCGVDNGMLFSLNYDADKRVFKRTYLPNNASDFFKALGEYLEDGATVLLHGCCTEEMMRTAAAAMPHVKVLATPYLANTLRPYIRPDGVLEDAMLTQGRHAARSGPIFT